jgi:hypothetical protein
MVVAVVGNRLAATLAQPVRIRLSSPPLAILAALVGVVALKQHNLLGVVEAPLVLLLLRPLAEPVTADLALRGEAVCPFSRLTTSAQKPAQKNRDRTTSITTPVTNVFSEVNMKLAFGRNAMQGSAQFVFCSGSTTRFENRSNRW